MAMTQRQALNMWRRALTEYVKGEESDMTARQQAVLMTVALTAGPHTVRGLSEQLNIAKPAVTRAIDVLSRAGYVTRAPDPKDARSVFINRTVEGTAWLNSFAGLILDAQAIPVEMPKANQAAA